MEITGTIKLIKETEHISSSFKKRELVITTDEQYAQHILVEFTQDKTELLNIFSPGENVRVSINLRGREWVNPQGETKYFNSIQGWRIEKTQTTTNHQNMPSQQPQSAVNDYFNKNNDSIEESNDDLPF